MPPQIDDRLGLTRRGVLAGAAAAGIAAVAGTAPDAGARSSRARRTTRRRADVIVVGAGAAGSAAAHAVAKRGRSVIVLEARERVGGRTLNHELGARWPGKIAEIGGTFVGPTQDRIHALIKETGLSTFPTYDRGRTTSILAGHKALFSNSDPAAYATLVPSGGDEILPMLLKLQAMANEVPVAAPWTAPRAREWDGQTLESWARQNIADPAVRGFLDVFTVGCWGCHMRDLSLLWALFYIAAASDAKTQGQGLVLLSTTTGGAQQDRIVGGSQLIWQRIAEDLGRAVVLGAPVSRIDHAGRGVTVTSAKGRFTARRVIVAMSPALTARIMIDPAVSALRDQLVQRFPMGSYAKFEAVYEKPFWRDAGANGQVFGDNGVALSFDTSPPGGKPGVMAGFIGGDAARHWDGLGPRGRREFGLKALAEYFGPRMLRPLEYSEARWTDEVWSRGGPTGFTPPGALTGFGTALRKPVGQIHWAGTETSDRWPGYMEGAVRSGQRAAAEVLDRL